MRLFLTLILAFSLVGCESFGRKKPSSNWATLDDASAVNCSRWPKREKDLGLRDIVLTDPSLPMFLVTGVGREGGPFHYAVPFTQDTDVDVERARAMTFGRGAVLVGGTVFGGKAYAVVAQPKGDKTILEVRSVPDNVIRYEFDIGVGDVAEGSVEQHGGAAWILLQRDGGDITLFRLGVSKGKFSGRNVGGSRWRDRPQIVPAGSKGGVFAVSREGAGFKVRHVAADGTLSSRVGSLDVKPQSEIESWAVGKARQGGSYYLAFVDGDSLVGLSSLKVANFSAGDDGDANVNWTREAVLKDVHVGEPVFQEVAGQLEVLLLNWVDEESTIARYQVSPAGLGKPKFSGIFSKGSRISLGMEAKGDLYVVMRHKDDNQWAIQLCEL
jgi:hypothetical protein